MAVKTVGELKEALNKFSDNMELRLLLSWYDRSNYNYATADNYWIPRGKGIQVSVYENDGCCLLENELPADIDVYD